MICLENEPGPEKGEMGRAKQYLTLQISKRDSVTPPHPRGGFWGVGLFLIGVYSCTR